MSGAPANRLVLAAALLGASVTIVAIYMVRRGDRDTRTRAETPAETVDDVRPQEQLESDASKPPPSSAVRELPDPGPALTNTAVASHTLSLSGRVVDAVGRPQIGWVVQLANPRRTVFETKFNVPRTHTDGDGRFTIDGLADQSLTLSAIHREFALRFDSTPLRPGAPTFDIVIPDAQFVPRVHGRVVGRGGAPRAGLQLCVQVAATFDDGTTSTLTGLQTKSNAEGEFDMRHVPRQDSTLLVLGDDLMPITLPIAELDTTREVRIEIHERREFVIEGLPERMEDWHFSVRNAQGVELDVFNARFPKAQAAKRVRVQPSRSGVYAVSDSAVELILFAGEKLLGTRALGFTDSGVTTVIW